MEYPDCLLCKQAKATKTNSHIVPSFLVAKVCSYDGSGKRDKEVMFTMTPYEEKVYIGQIPDTKLEELFDTVKLTDERIGAELSDNTASKDYIFCPQCEKRFSDILESPYAQSLKGVNKVSGDVAYMFWLSVVWRLSVSGQFQFRMPDYLEEGLRKDLYDYIVKKENGEDTACIIANCPFRYALFKSADSDANKKGFLGGTYNYDYNILAYSIGDTVLCAKFCSNTIPVGYHHHGMEKHFSNAIFNDGNDEEVITEIDSKEYNDFVECYVKDIAYKRFLSESELLDKCWKESCLEGKMPNEMKIEFITKLYSEDSKQGDRHTHERYVELFNQILQKHGYIPKV